MVSITLSFVIPIFKENLLHWWLKKNGTMLPSFSVGSDTGTTLFSSFDQSQCHILHLHCSNSPHNKNDLSHFHIFVFYTLNSMRFQYYLILYFPIALCGQLQKSVTWSKFGFFICSLVFLIICQIPLQKKIYMNF